METYLSIEEVAKYLGIAEKTIRKWVLNQEIPYRKIHKIVRFRLSEIEKWVDGNCFVLPEEKQETAEGDVINGAIPHGTDRFREELAASQNEFAVEEAQEAVEDGAAE